MVITMLPDSSAVKTVYLDADTGIVPAALSTQADKKIIMECGTIETATILEVAKAAHTSNNTSRSDETVPTGQLTFVDAPVSGGPMGAEAATLTFMVGGSDEVFPVVQKILAYMGKPENVFHCGAVGAGTAFKVINNYLSGITTLAASEALNVGVKMGLNPRKLTDVINASGGQCWVTSQCNPVPGINPNAAASRGYEGGFRIELCKKVFKMGIELADMVGARTILDKPTLAAFEEAAADERYKGKDARIVYKWLNESES